jgi:2-polyprenyl-6-methoxyphenol hydroxylase-like FAD-dependent oxidoreductase
MPEANEPAPRIVIAGAGPAGMVLAYQLASNGLPVRVLEQHPDFERELRGELIGPSVFPVLERLGVMPILIERGLARSGVERKMFIGPSRQVRLPSGGEPGALISQPGLLAVLDELSRATGRYTLDFKTSAQKAIVEGGRVVGLEVLRDGRAERLASDLVIVCSGRGTKLRKTEGVETELAEKPDDTLWLRFDLSDAPEALPKDTLVHMFGGGIVVVLFATTRSRLQIAYSAPGNLGALRRDLPALRAALLPRLNEPLRAIVGRKLSEDTETQVLKVSIDRLKRWWVPGMLFLGDAAHTMGPAGAQGLNLAIRDAIVAADHLLDAGGATDEVLAKIEAARRPEIEAAQAGQLRAYGMVHKPLLVQHSMFTILSLVMRLKKLEGPAAEAVSPRHVAPRQ